jgi:ribosome-binding protein aMBF1 (putative translation factor)
MKMMITVKEYSKKDIGEIGSPEREKFKEESYAYYLSEILKSRRKQLKWSQEELAIKVGKKRTYISRVENGADLRISNFIQIANVLGLNFELKPA